MTSYFIEVRLTGKIQRETKSLIREVRKEYRLHGERPVPHISIIYRPTPTNPLKYDEKCLVKDFTDACEKQNIIMECKLNGFSSFDNNGAATIKVEPDDRFVQFRKELIRRLQPHCALHQEFDRENEFEPHIAIARKLNPDDLKKIKYYLKGKESPRLRYCLTRVSLLKNMTRNIEKAKILVEYDFFLDKLLNREQALNPLIQRKTVRELKMYLADKQTYNDSRKKRKYHSAKPGFLRKLLRGIVKVFRP